jgi:lysophosphatidate acyltransferase
MDILFLAHVWPKYCSVTAKSVLKYYPFLGQFSTPSGPVAFTR